MMFYRGPVTLTHADGTERTLSAEVNVHREGQLFSWDGTLTGELRDLRALYGADDLTLAIPDRGEGRILVTNVTIGTMGSHAEFQGNGPLGELGA